MTHIGIKKENYQLLGGNDPNKVINENPFEIYNKDTINFLSILSQELLKNKKSTKFKDFIGFGFWARKANILNLRNARKDINSRIGRGTSFHIAPSNISANALYTFAFGLLSGCPSLIRLSSKNKDELKDILSLINLITESIQFDALANKFSFINYDHETNLSSYYSSLVDARVIWGGDETIQLFKSFKTNPHCIDIVFPNKVSSSIISGNWLSSSNHSEIRSKADLYSRDIGLFSQMACSSPSNMIFLKDNKELERKHLLEFFDYCDKSLSKKEWLSEIHSTANFKSSVDICMRLPNIDCLFKGENISVFLAEKRQFSVIKNYKPKDCCLFLFEANSIEEASKLLSKNNQTIVCIGLKKDLKEKLAKKVMIKGTNRIVSAGNALNMNIFWDGYDIISYLSKLICLN